MRSSFFILDREHVGEHVLADMWDDGWANEKSTIPKKKVKV
ncbi:jg7, partial [Pararge aegeria aegeria]